MRRSHAWCVVVLILAALPLVACAQTTPATASRTQPVTVEKIDGSEFNRLMLTEKAFERLNIQTALVREEQINGSPRKIIPYGAVIYGLSGETWAYISPQPLTFVRHAITVDYITGDTVMLLDGPPAGATIVTAGAAELYAADTGMK